MAAGERSRMPESSSPTTSRKQKAWTHSGQGHQPTKPTPMAYILKQVSKSFTIPQIEPRTRDRVFKQMCLFGTFFIQTGDHQGRWLLSLLKTFLATEMDIYLNHMFQRIRADPGG